ncbi:ricin-type beta-trefoil lectin domain protein [Micromonospora sp. NPDC020750]|uniref:ricin-type beta-trefoil lectin domain protein n=1 Tax=unclassified Micromonospora TaxID=2617518 RepID=UPI0037A016D6
MSPSGNPPHDLPPNRPPTATRRPRHRGLATALLAVCVPAAAGIAVATAPSAFAAPVSVGVHLTTTSDAAGRTVTRGLQQQTPVGFAASSPNADQTITVDDSVRYQTFEGGGASITDTTAHLLRGGVVSAATRDAVMTKLFSPTTGIGLSFVRNPIGASDLSRPGNTSLDDTCCDLSDFGTNGYDTNVRLLTQQAKQLNPELRVKGVPWSAPGWMKTNGRMDQMGSLKTQYYALYAQYLVKYIQSYARAGVPINYISVQNEPNCCKADNPTEMNYPGMAWTPDQLIDLTKNHVYPALRAAGLTTKVMVQDFNYGDYWTLGQNLLQDPGIRTDPLFGGIAWHGYWGEPNIGTVVHHDFPNVRQFSTEHSGGTWISNQHNEDLGDIVNYARNYSSSLIKWSLALNQNHGPHNGGCDVCTGLITVQEGGARAGQVDYTVEYYTTGHLTKFVRPGAQRIDSTETWGVQNVAWRNTDGSKALIVHNPAANAQPVKVNSGGQSFTYTMPARTTATFTWNGAATPPTTPPATTTPPTTPPPTTPPPTTPPPTGSGTVTGLGGRCLDVVDKQSGDGTPVQIWDCHGEPNQQWSRPGDGTLRSLGKCLDVSGAATNNGARVQISTCNGTAAQRWTATTAGTLVNPQSDRCLDVVDVNNSNGARLQIWDCHAQPNQTWVLNG